MTGYASRGPVPKRTDDKIRTAPGAVETKKLYVDRLISQEVEIPAADESWHPVARLWWDSVVSSAQSVYYEPSDWAVAYATAEAMSREMSDQVVAVIPASEHGEGRVVWGKAPIKGAFLNSLKAIMTNLLITEGDRRRAGIEIVRAVQNEDATEHSDAEVLSMEERRNKLAGNG